MIIYDDIANVLLCWIDGSIVEKFKPSPHDQYLLFEYYADDVVGIELANANSIPLDFWLNHQGRHLIQKIILDEIDLWLRERQ